MLGTPPVINPTKIGAALPPQPKPPYNRPTCLSYATNELTGEGNSAPHEEAVKEVGEAASAYTAGEALQHAGERALTVPMRSSIVQTWLGLSEAFGTLAEVVPLAFLATQMARADVKTIQARYNGECKGPTGWTAYGPVY